MPGEVTVFGKHFEKRFLVLLLPSRTEDHLALLQVALVLAVLICCCCRRSTRTNAQNQLKSHWQQD